MDRTDHYRPGYSSLENWSELNTWEPSCPEITPDYFSVHKYKTRPTDPRARADGLKLAARTGGADRRAGGRSAAALLILRTMLLKNGLGTLETRRSQSIFTIWLRGPKHYAGAFCIEILYYFFGIIVILKYSWDFISELKNLAMFLAATGGG